MTTAEAREKLERSVSEMVAVALAAATVDAGELVERRLAITNAIDAFAEAVRADAFSEVWKKTLHMEDSGLSNWLLQQRDGK